MPAAAAFAAWLATDPSKDDRAAAVTLLSVPLIELDGMADPLFDEPPSTFQQLRDATLYNKPPKQIQNTTATKDNAAMLTITIANNEDAARLPALLAAILAQFSAAPLPSCSPAPYEHTAAFVASPISTAAISDAIVAKAESVAIAAQAAVLAVEAPKRTRRTKAEMEAAAAVVAEPVAEVVQPVTAWAADIEDAKQVSEEQDDADAEEAAVAEVVPPAKPLAEADVLAVLRAAAMRNKVNVEKVKTILTGYGATNLKSLPAEHYAAVIAAVEVLA